VSKLTEKINNIFGRKEKSETPEFKKDKSMRETMWGTSDIARSIQESEKFQTQKRCWRNIFYF